MIGGIIFKNEDELKELVLEYYRLITDEETVRVMTQAAAGMPISALDINRAKRPQEVTKKIASLLNVSEEELFNKGMLESLVYKYVPEFSVNTRTYSNNERLVEVVPKVYDQPEGIFANINNDLNECRFNPRDTPPKILLAYAYARMYAAAGLRLQGVFTIDDFKHSMNFLSALITYVNKNKQLMDEAKKEAIEYMRSYDQELTSEIVSAAVGFASNSDIRQPPKEKPLPYPAIKFLIKRTLEEIKKGIH